MQLNVLEYLEQGALAGRRDRGALWDAQEEFSFGDLEWYAKRMAALIIQRHDAIQQPVAVFLPKCARTVLANLGILYSGNLYTNLDVKSPPERLKRILENVAPVLIITNRELLPTLLALGADPARMLCVEEAFDEGLAYDNARIWARLEKVVDTDPVCIINTSGSTGVPKSVVMHHRSIIDFIDWTLARFTFDEHDVIGSLSPFYFDIYTLELYVALARGCRLVIIPENLAAFPAKLVQFLAEKCVSFLFWVPTIMVTIANLDLLKSTDLRRIKKVFFAGEVFPTKHLNYWRRWLPQALFVNLYGPIEITVDCTYFVVDREFKDDEAIPIGFPCRNTDILILNEQNRPTATNEPGELCVRGSSLALGYWNNPEQTAKAFTQNPLNSHYPEIIYRTGDLVFRNERGEIMFMGRKDYQIKHLGYRIELAEIETAVTAIPDILNACVLYNHAKKEITLFFESKVELSPGDIRQRLTERLPKYMLPTAFNRLAAMPRNPNGKIDRQELTETHLKQG